MYRSHRNTIQRRPLRLESLETRELLTVIMTPQEQLMIELVNRARADPLGEAERFDLELNEGVEEDRVISEDPKQPLAPHQSLTDAAGDHAEDMLLRNYFGHDSPEGESPGGRVRKAGYPQGAGENIAWHGHALPLDETQEVYDRHQGLVGSVGHRLNMMREVWREVGAGVRYGMFTKDFTDLRSVMVGTLFGNRGGNNFITGVAITDQVRRNQFYEIGEGIGEATITAVREGTGESYSDITGPAGGYGIRVPNGTYNVTASGGLFLQSITVRGVQIDSGNFKVDFNRAVMPTRYISGSVFHDSNGNGYRDRNEQGSVGQTIYLDYDDNEALDDDDPSTLTDLAGNFRFDDLLSGEYIVRLNVPPRNVQTFPDRIYNLTLSDRNLVGADFGIQSHNIPPISRDDQATVRGGESLRVSVLDNDIDPDDHLAISSIRIVSRPDHGTVTVNSSTGKITFLADEDFSGIDKFTYTVNDTDGAVSNVATTQIIVTPARPWQNSAEPLDVNRDGFVVSQDVLIVIREINRGGAGPLLHRIRQADFPFYDVSGDNFLSPLDALRIIRYLNGQAAEAEPSDSLADIATTDSFFAIAASLVENNK